MKHLMLRNVKAILKHTLLYVPCCHPWDNHSNVQYDQDDSFAIYENKNPCFYHRDLCILKKLAYKSIALFQDIT